jgi:tetratricopeptide (TPR) repeat protein
MSQLPNPERIAAMRERMAEIGRAVSGFRDALRESNDERHQAFFAPVLDRVALIVANEQAGATIHIADDLSAARSAVRRLGLPDIDPVLNEPTPALKRLRGERGNLVEALDNALDAAQALGHAPALTEIGELRVQRNAFSDVLIRLDERLRVVQDAVADLRTASVNADTAPSGGTVSQTGLVNIHIQTLTVEVSAARFETRIGDAPGIPDQTDLASLARSIEALRDIAGDLKETVEGLGPLVVAGVRVAGGVVARAADRSWRGMQTVVSVVRRRLAGSRRRTEAAQAGRTIADAGLDQDIPRQDPVAAAERIEQLAERRSSDDAAKLLAALRTSYGEWHERGRDKGLNFDLQVAIELANRALKRTHPPKERGDWHNLLGNALQTLGERESGTARLEEAVSAYRAALEERTRDRVPLDWAMTQNNLGNALATLGERASGTARLEEAVSAYRAALEERTRDRVPLDWAATQNNLGNVLQTLGGRESGTARLEEAVSAYRAALEELTQDRVPLDWATTLNNLGNVLWTLGGRESGTTRLEEAVSAYRAALEELTRDRVPLDWATTQNNLGAALQALGERESGTAWLEEAVSAYRAALEERTQDRVPLDWAMTQTNLGNALATLGGRESGTARLEEAVSAYRAALEERMRDRVPLDWAMSFGNQGVALMHLADRSDDTELAETALRQIEMARDVTRDGGHAVNAAYYDSQLPQARAVLARLRGR